MGNTLVLDATTGSLMELSPGFVPIAMKEYGGILYIASVNKDGVGEIGSLPSPVITWSRDDVTYVKVGVNDLVTEDGPVKTLTRISDRLRTGNKFIVILDFGTVANYELHLREYQFQWWHTWDRNVDLITKRWKDVTGTTELKKGLYDILLYSIGDTNTQRLESAETQQEYVTSETVNNVEITGNKSSDYWFILNNTNIDLLRTFADKALLKNYPKTGSGYLAIKAALESIKSFSCLPRDKQQRQYIPVTEYDATTGLYTSRFLGFKVTTESGIIVNKIKVEVINETTRKTMPIHWSDGTVGSLCTFWTDAIPVDDDDNPIYQSGYANSITPSDGVLTTYLLGEDSIIPNNLFYSESSNFNENDRVILCNEQGTEGKKATLFYIENTIQNTWYTVTVKYYDQFDNQIGTCTVVFNPYVNDELDSIYQGFTKSNAMKEQKTAFTKTVLVDAIENPEISFNDAGNSLTSNLATIGKVSYITGGIKGTNYRLSEVYDTTRKLQLVDNSCDSSYLGISKIQNTAINLLEDVKWAIAVFGGDSNLANNLTICDANDLELTSLKLGATYSIWKNAGDSRNLEALYINSENPIKLYYTDKSGLPKSLAIKNVDVFNGEMPITYAAVSYGYPFIIGTLAELTKGYEDIVKEHSITNGTYTAVWDVTPTINADNIELLISLPGNGPRRYNIVHNSTTGVVKENIGVTQNNSYTGKDARPKIELAVKDSTVVITGTANSYKIIPLYSHYCKWNDAEGNVHNSLAGINYKDALEHLKNDDITDWANFYPYLTATNLEVDTDGIPVNFLTLNDTLVQFTSSSYQNPIYEKKVDSDTLVFSPNDSQNTWVALAYFSGTCTDGLESGRPYVINDDKAVSFNMAGCTVYRCGLFKVTEKLDGTSHDIVDYPGIVMPLVENYYENNQYGDTTYKNFVENSNGMITLIPEEDYSVNSIFLKDTTTRGKLAYMWNNRYAKKADIDVEDVQYAITTVSGNYIQFQGVQDLDKKPADTFVPDSSVIQTL